MSNQLTNNEIAASIRVSRNGQGVLMNHAPKTHRMGRQSIFERKITLADVTAVFLAALTFKLTAQGVLENQPGLVSNIGYIVYIATAALSFVLFLKYSSIATSSSIPFVLITFFIAVLNIGTTVFHGGDVGSFGSMHFLCMDLIIFLAICYESDRWDILELYITACSVIYIVFSLEIFLTNSHLFTSSNRESYILGHQNGYSILAIVLVSLNLVYLLDKGFSSFRLLFVIVATASIFGVWSATGIAGFLLLFIVFIFFVTTRWTRNIPLLPYMLVAIAVFFLIVVLRMQDQPVIRLFVEEVLQKDLTFNNRLRFWDFGWYWLTNTTGAESLVGYGRDAAVSRAIIPGGYSAFHNYIYDIWYYSGIVGLGLYLTFNLYVCTASKSGMITRGKNMAIAGYGILLIVMQFESYQSYWHYALILFLAAFCCFYRKDEIATTRESTNRGQNN